MSNGSIDNKHTLSYIIYDMKTFAWDKEKNEKLKSERGISFEDIIFCIKNGLLLDVINHPNFLKYENQKIYIINLNNYIYLVPFVETKNELFLKTIYPSRKYTKNYLKK